MDVKNPRPHHPLAAAAAAEDDEIQRMISAPLAVPSAPPEPVKPVVTPEPKPPEPARPAVDPAVEKLQHNFETMLGRVETLNAENKRLAEEAAAKEANRVFLEQRLNERNAEVEKALARLRELEGALEVNEASKGFTSELVDQAHFAEIFRGITPHLRKRDEMIERVLARNDALEKKLDEVLNSTRQEVAKLDQKWLDRSVLRTTPEITQMLKSAEGQEFLAQRVPGTRRTRLQELQDAYRDGDDTFISELVADWKRLGKPQEVPTPDPARTIVTETPRAPQPERPVSEDDVQSAFQQVLDGRMTREDFRKIKATFEKQLVAGR
jgi:hypothetical protein